MKKFLLPALILGLVMTPGDTSGFVPPAGGTRPPPPRPTPPAAPIHTPSFSVPRPTSPPVVHPSAPVVRTAPPPVHTYTPSVVRTAPPMARPYTPPIVHTTPSAVHTPGFVPQPRPVAPTVTRPFPTSPGVVRPSPTVVGRPAPSNFVRPPPPFNRPVVGIGNYPATVIRPAMIDRGVYINRPTGLYQPGYAHYHQWYGDWHHGYWHGWPYGGLPWNVGATTIGWLWPPAASAVFWNPYYNVLDQPLFVSVYNYSQPIPVPAPMLIAPETVEVPAGAPTPQIPDTSLTDDNAAAAKQLFDQARQAFRLQDLNTAQQQIDQAITRLPNDTTMHEFRALVLFARMKYQDAAATIYSVLAVAPGWDWETLRALYQDSQTYTLQLRALEDFSRANPTDTASRFLLAYHYLVLDAREAAAKVLASVVALQPKDELAARLLESLQKKTEVDRPKPGI